MTLSAVKILLSGEEAYTFQKPSGKIKRNRVFVRTIDQQWDVDLMDMTKVAKYNDDYHYILLAIDIFSHYVWMVPLRDKSGNEVVCALKKNEYVLRIEGDPKTTKYIIYGADRPLIHCFIDCAHNILEGNIPLGLKEKKRLGKYKQEL